MKTWNEQSIKALLDSNTRAVEKAIVAIYQRQTGDEKASKHTNHINGMGFSKYDAEFMSSLAEWIMRGRTLTPRQLAIGRNKIKRYHRQLVEIANAKESQKEPAQPQGEVDTTCTCAEHEWYDGEDVCPGCHAAGRVPESVRRAIAANAGAARTWG